MRPLLPALASLWLLSLGCRSSAPDSSAAPPASAAAQASSAPAQAASAPAAAPAASASTEGGSAAASGGAAAMASVRPRCCRLDRTEGSFGPDKGVHASYSGDVLLLNNGDRLLFPQDLISDTKELYIFAKSAGKSLHQERRLRVVGEGPSYVSVEIEDRGETGAATPFFHARCATLDLRKARPVALSDVLDKASAEPLLDEGRKRFEQAPGHERFRFVSASFALTDGAVHFCCPARDDRQVTPLLDVEVPRPASK